MYAEAVERLLHLRSRVLRGAEILQVAGSDGEATVGIFPEIEVIVQAEKLATLVRHGVERQAWCDGGPADGFFEINELRRDVGGLYF